MLVEAGREAVSRPPPFVPVVGHLIPKRCRLTALRSVDRVSRQKRALFSSRFSACRPASWSWTEPASYSAPLTERSGSSTRAASAAQPMPRERFIRLGRASSIGPGRASAPVAVAAEPRACGNQGDHHADSQSDHDADVGHRPRPEPLAGDALQGGRAETRPPQDLPGCCAWRRHDLRDDPRRHHEAPRASGRRRRRSRDTRPQRNRSAAERIGSHSWPGRRVRLPPGQRDGHRCHSGAATQARSRRRARSHQRAWR